MKSNIYTLRQPFTKAIIFIFLVLVSFSGFGQKIVPFGSGTLNQLQPFADDVKFSRSAAVYSSNALKVKGIITRLDWNVFSTLPAGTNETVSIYLKEILVDTIPSTDWAALNQNAILVYTSATLNFNTTGWKQLILSTVFNKLNASSNILVLIDKSSATPTGANAPKFMYDDTPAVNNHASATNGTTAPTTLTKNKKRPDIRFEIALAPSGFKVVDPTISSLTLNWALNSVSDSVLILKGLSSTLPTMLQGTATEWHVNDSISGAVVAYKGKDISFINTNLNSNTSYFYRIFSFFTDNTGSKHVFYSPYLDTTGKTLEAAFMISFSNQFTTDKDSICAAKPDNDTVFGQIREGRVFQWYSRLDPSPLLLPIPGANSKDYIIDHTGLPAGKYYYCRYDSVKNMIGPVNQSNIVSFKIFPLSVGGTILGTLDTSACLNSPITLTLEEYTGNVLYWMRQKPGEVYKKIPNPVDIIEDLLNVPGTWKYYVVVQSGICDSATSKEFNILVKPKPVVTALVEKDPICSGERTKVTLTSEGTGVKYYWKRDNVDKVSGPPADSTSSVIDYTYTIKPPAQSDVTVKFTASVVLDLCKSDTITKTVTVRPIPALDKIQGDTTVCSEIALYSLNIVAGTTYQWTITPTESRTIVGKSDSTGVNVQWLPVTSPQTSVVKGTVTYTSSGCSAFQATTVTVSTGTAPGPEMLVRKTPVVPGELFLFCHNFINNLATNYNFTWGYENSAGEETLNPEPDYQDKYFCLFKGYDASKGFKYFVKMNDKTSGKACFTKTYWEQLPTELTPQNDFSIYPNPNAGSFNLEIDYETLGSFELALFDILGHECARLSLTKSQRTESFRISVSSLMRGTYVAMIKFPDGSQLIKKMVIY